MPVYIALLRAVNVGGTGKLPMSELTAMCIAEAFSNVKTYIASGNVIFSANKSESTVKTLLETRLHAYARKSVGVIVRSANEMVAVLADNPFANEPPNSTVAIFLDRAPASDALEGVRGASHEKFALGKREIYVAYGAGMGTSKLKIPAASAGTARNMNTVKKLAEIAAAM